MKKILFFISCLFVSVFGRENPFVATSELNTSVVTTNIIENLPPFERENFKFPSDAREFISLTLKYKSSDGSIKDKVISIERSIDWHDELMLNRVASPNLTVKADDVSVTKSMPKVASAYLGEVDQTQIEPKSAEPLQEIVINATNKFEPLKSFLFKDVKLEVATMELKFVTKDKKIRDFALYGDRRLVIDFSGMSGFYTKTIDINCGVFRDVIFGAHKDFYRAVVSLDGAYNYKISKTDNGYLLKISHKK
ncbi:MAG: AMIN domain-containing protein [Campylobacter sp.]